MLDCIFRLSNLQHFLPPFPQPTQGEAQSRLLPSQTVTAQHFRDVFHSAFFQLFNEDVPRWDIAPIGIRTHQCRARRRLRNTALRLPRYRVRRLPLCTDRLPPRCTGHLRHPSKDHHRPRCTSRRQHRSTCHHAGVGTATYARIQVATHTCVASPTCSCVLIARPSICHEHLLCDSQVSAYPTTMLQGCSKHLGGIRGGIQKMPSNKTLK
jgi:hypothetical protein